MENIPAQAGEPQSRPAGPEVEFSGVDGGGGDRDKAESE